MIKEFKQFLLRGNVVDLAVGVVIGTAFGVVVSSLAKGLITPIVGAIAGSTDFSRLTFTINGSVFMYGEFLNAVISFIIVSAAVFFFVVKPMNILVARSHRGESVDPSTKKCPQCIGEIPFQATRCMHCTQVVTTS